MLSLKKLSSAELSKNSSYKNHVEVVEFEDKECGLLGFVAIHNETLGAAVGGTRVFPYASKNEALTDVLRLSEAMTYKCAVAGIHQGGGKAVIIGNPKTVKTPALLKSYAEAIGSLKGRFYTGEDVGLAEADVQYMLKFVPYFIGKSGQAGDPSEFASLSVYTVMQEAAKKVLKKKTLKGVRVGIKGLGKVGYGLVKLLAKDGAVIVGADIDTSACDRIHREYPSVKIVPANKILGEEIDIYAPCAMGNEFTPAIVQASASPKIICGGANNQLSCASVAANFQNKGILYVPDYLANAGGLIDVADELEEGGFNRERVTARIEMLRATFNTLFKTATTTGTTLSTATNAFAEQEFSKK